MINENITLIHLGNIYGDFGTGYAGNVWNSDGLCPTLTNTGGGGGRMPMIITQDDAQIKVIGQMEEESGKTYESINRVYSIDGLAPTVNTCQGGQHEPKVLVEEPVVMKSQRSEYGKVIRKKYESHELEASWDDVTELIPKNDGTSNTITTVLKDNMILEPQIVQKSGDRDKEGSYTMHDYSNCIPANPMSDRGQLVIEPRPCAMRGRNPDDPSDRTAGLHTEQRIEVNNSGISNCITSVGKDSMVLEGNYKIPDMNNYNQRAIVHDKNSIGRTVMGSGHVGNELKIIDEVEEMEDAKINKIGNVVSETSQHGTVVDDEGLFPTLSAGTHGYCNGHVQTKYRIRKLTPKETGRLMGVSDEDIDQILSVQSATQAYKEFGNSIVVNVLTALFGQMFDGKENFYKEVAI